MLSVFSKIIDLLTPQERRNALILLLLLILMAIFDVIGVVSIMPFMAVVSNPEVIETNDFLSLLYRELSFSNTRSFLIFLGICVFGALLLSMMVKTLTTYAQYRFVLMREFTIGKRLVAGYLNQPYSWFLNRHSADLGKSILSEVNTVLSGSIMPFMILISQTIIVLAMLMLLIFVDTSLAIVVGSSLGIAYFIIYKSLSKRLSSIGSERLAANKERFKLVNEAFSGIKEIKFCGLEHVYLQRFSQPAKIYSKHHATASVITNLPRFALELLAFGGMILVVLYLLTGNGSLETGLPVISLYAMAGYRLIPAFQAIYNSFSSLKYAGPSLNALHGELSKLNFKSIDSSKVKSITINEAVSLSNISYSYPGASRKALDELNVKIRAKTTVGLVGPTGSGKTTTVDLILGLLEPGEGELLVDKMPITSINKRSWQKSIGYVPQNIHLVDDSIAANIAYGVEPENMDLHAVKEAARIANLHEFIMEELQDDYKTVIGEKGVRLSGGQKQRIGIARALYHKPDLLILDEATSALDTLTEKAVMDAINNLGHKVTIIIIAHRISTVRKCDEIFLLEKGRVECSGSYEQLLDSSETFKLMSTK